MVTKVGMQVHFGDAVRDLLSLEYDVIEAYKSAISRLDNEQYKHQMVEFLKDHELHAKELSNLLSSHNINVPSGPDMKKWLAKGKVFLSDLVGDNSILSAMSSNEDDTNTAYERIADRDDIWDDARDLIKGNLSDARRHKAWLDEEK